MQNYCIISSIQMCYIECHNLNKISLTRLLILMNRIVLAVNKHDTLRYVGI